MYWNKILERARDTYYIEFLMTLTCSFIIIFYFSGRKKNHANIFLVILASASLLQALFAECLTIISPVFNSLANRYAIFLYTNVEIVCCLLFLKANIKSAAAKKIILLESGGFVFYTILYWSLNHASWHSLQLIELVEGFLIMPNCLYYFYELFTQKSESNHITASTLWVISSMLILFGSMSPLILFHYFFNHEHYKILQDHLFIINYLAYTQFFITIAIAIVFDKKPLTTGRRTTNMY